MDEFGIDRVATAVFDVRDAAAMDAALADLPEAFRGIDVLVNNRAALHCRINGSSTLW